MPNKFSCNLCIIVEFDIISEFDDKDFMTAYVSLWKSGNPVTKAPNFWKNL